MSLLLLARFVMLLALAALVAYYVWAATAGEA
jgi:hypothetical protein